MQMAKKYPAKRKTKNKRKESTKKTPNPKQNHTMLQANKQDKKISTQTHNVFLPSQKVLTCSVVSSYSH